MQYVGLGLDAGISRALDSEGGLAVPRSDARDHAFRPTTSRSACLDQVEQTGQVGLGVLTREMTDEHAGDQHLYGRVVRMNSSI
jgi:hypothetical protein